MNPTDHTITQAITAKLEETGTSRYAVAKAAGLPYTTFNRKLDHGSYTVKELADIAAALKTPFADLLGVAA